MNTNFYLTGIFSESVSPIIFVDFDGTIAEKDVIDQILENFADERWLEVEEQWTSGKIGSRECLRQQFALVKAFPAELDEFLDTLKLDEGFPAILRFCKEAGIEMHIVSDGFEYYIRRMLEKSASNQQLLGGINIWANRLIPCGRNRWRTEFPYFETACEDNCATCKPAVMREQNPFAAPSIFIGDGLSDRFAAQSADIVFAKKKLSEYCLENRIPQTAYANLKQVAECLDEAFENFVMTLTDGQRSWLEAA
ncbi:MAG: MtnX-like HAD-IB family phosphatase [Actinomycetota bacterium]